MKIEIDQSGKIEDTAKPTAVAYTNSKTGSISLPARTKRRLQDQFRRMGEPKLFIIFVFTALIYILIKDDVKQISEIIIDTEYPGQDNIIRKLLLRMIGEENITERLSINFKQVGRSSMSHKIALTVHRGFKRADIIATYKQIVEECMDTKNGYPALKYQVTMDKR
jgi:hypothetical protein